MREITKTFEGVTFTVCRPTNGMRTNRDRIYVALSVPDDRITAIRQDEFARIASYSKDVKGLDFEFPNPNWERAKIKESFNKFENDWDGALTEVWLQAIEEVMAPTDPALGVKPLMEDADPN